MPTTIMFILKDYSITTPDPYYGIIIDTQYTLAISRSGYKDSRPYYQDTLNDVLRQHCHNLDGISMLTHVKILY